MGRAQILRQQNLSRYTEAGAKFRISWFVYRVSGEGWEPVPYDFFLCGRQDLLESLASIMKKRSMSGGMKRGAEELQDALDYAKGILNTAREPILVIDENLRVISANRSFYNTFRVSAKETLGQYLPDLGNKQWNIPNLLHLIEDILPSKEVVEDYEVEHDFETIGHRIMNLNACQLHVAKEVAKTIVGKNGGGGRGKLILLAIEDVTERRKAERELKLLDKRKSDFVANVSHEFRNPLGIIRENFNLLLEEIEGPIKPKQKRILEIGQKTTERLIRLVNNLLDISKIESGKVKMRREQFDLLPLLNEILISFESSLSKKQLTLRKNIPQDIGSMWADRDMLIQVIHNLLNNAVKYTPNGERIAVKLVGSHNEIRFEISDSGPGIPKEDYQRIFDKFERITAEKQEGAGLGLPIAKDIIDLHGGKIWIESEVGKNSKFIFVLPRNWKK